MWRRKTHEGAPPIYARWVCGGGGEAGGAPFVFPPVLLSPGAGLTGFLTRFLTRISGAASSCCTRAALLLSRRPSSPLTQTEPPPHPHTSCSSSSSSPPPVSAGSRCTSSPSPSPLFGRFASTLQDQKAAADFTPLFIHQVPTPPPFFFFGSKPGVFFLANISKQPRVSAHSHPREFPLGAGRKMLQERREAPPDLLLSQPRRRYHSSVCLHFQMKVLSLCFISN